MSILLLVLPLRGTQAVPILAHYEPTGVVSRVDANHALAEV